jgi:hypothetical protein
MAPKDSSPMEDAEGGGQVEALSIAERVLLTIFLGERGFPKGVDQVGMIAEITGLSRDVVREALVDLHRQGLVDEHWLR